MKENINKQEWKSTRGSCIGFFMVIACYPKINTNCMEFLGAEILLLNQVSIIKEHRT